MTITKTAFVRPAFVFQVGTPPRQGDQPDWNTVATIELQRSSDERGVFRIDDARIPVPDAPELRVWCAFEERVNSVSMAVAEVHNSRTIQRATIGANFLHSGTFGFALDDGRHIQVYLVDLNRESLRTQPREG